MRYMQGMRPQEATAEGDASVYATATQDRL